MVTALSQVLKLVISLGSQVVIARLLFPSDFGLLAMVYPIIGFIQVFNDLGLGQVIIQRPALEQAQVSALFWINIALSGALAFIVILLSPLAAWVYGEPRVTGIMASLALILPIAALGIHPVALLTRQMKFGLLARNEVAAALIGVIVTIATAWLGMSYWSLVLGQLCSTVSSDILGWAACKWRPSRPALHSESKADLKFGGNVTGANLANYITTSSDNIIIGVMNGKVPLGLYDRSYRLVVQPVSQMIAPISRVALPLLSRLADSPDAYRVAYLRIARALMLLTVPGMLVCIANAQTMIDVFLGDRWHDAGPVFGWICVGGLTSAIYSSAVWLFISQGRTRDMRNVLTVASVLNLASFLAGSFWGIVTVAAAAAIVFVLVTTPLVVFGATRSGPVRTRDMAALLATFSIGGALVYAMLLVEAHAFPLRGLAQIIVATLVAYGGFAMLTMAIPAERRAALSAINAVRPARNN
ncbi:lipopolysaccharide biosynthesis protein [Novosphingobium lentum]|uniref:lipopolysaccharide biosynthesis protein n=1 Tax=Novosphingobium lentum TaxID=145287 RepID=UPI0014700903|nr:lipopolysaccharide biosynthesis protein [Novosphingobium lentum]